MLTTLTPKNSKESQTFSLKRWFVGSKIAFGSQQINFQTSPFDFRQIPLQTKLKINTPGDRFEQEADRIADRVVNMNYIGRVTENGNSKIQRKSLLDEITNIGGSITQRKCSQCEEEEEETVQRKSLNTEPASTSSSFNSQLNATKGRGNSMDETTNKYMSSRFGVDFSHVNIHTNDKAAAMSQSVNARAFTLGNDIYFNRGEFDTQSADGKRLLAHELVHTLQQSKNIQRNPFRERERQRMRSIPIDYDLISDPELRLQMMREEYERYRWKDALDRLKKGELVDEDLKYQRLRNRLTGLKSTEVTSLIKGIKKFQSQRDRDIKNSKVTDPSKKVPIKTSKILEWLEVRRVISTPMPDNAKVKTDILGSIENYTIDLKDAKITVTPDSHGSSGNETRPSTNFEGRFSWTVVNGKITNLKKDNVPFNPKKLEVKIKTSYKNSPDVTSGYGKGTTNSDKSNKTTTLRVHEGQHGTDYINYLSNTPLPVSLTNGINGQLTPKQFKKLLDYINKTSKESCELTDQIGFSQDDYLKTDHGKTTGIVSCRKP